jgi:hypothetical protein
VLTTDLLRVRFYKKKLHPRYVSEKDPELLDLAEQMIDCFRAHENRPRHELEAELAELQGTDTDFLLHRAFAKLLFDRCDYEAATEHPPEELRSALFAAAARAYRGDDGAPETPETFSFDREAVLGTVAEELEMTPEALEGGLYADLKSEQRMVKLRPVGAQWLLRRYNVALAQGVLLRATELELELGPASPKMHRALFRKIKFFQLMHRVKRLPDGGWRVVLDGPVSLFKASGKYGFRMAGFLPTLLHFDDWSLSAQVQWGPKRRPATFELDSDRGLRSHTRLDGQWQPEELGWFPEQFEALDTDWQVSTDGELVDLGGEGVLVPDFVFVHEPSGQRVVMEVLGFWRKGAAASRLELLRRHGPENAVLALSSQLATGREDLDELPGEVYLFRTHPIARKVAKLLKDFEPAPAKKGRKKKAAKKRATKKKPSNRD